MNSNTSQESKYNAQNANVYQWFYFKDPKTNCVYYTPLSREYKEIPYEPVKKRSNFFTI